MARTVDAFDVTLDFSTGAPGITPRVGENGNWWIGMTDTGVPAQGPQGDPFTYDDFTPDQIAELQRPATEAAAVALEAAGRANMAADGADASKIAADEATGRANTAAAGADASKTAADEATGRANTAAAGADTAATAANTAATSADEAAAGAIAAKQGADAATAAANTASDNANAAAEEARDAAGDIPAWQTIEFLHRIASDPPSQAPDYRALNRLYRQLAGIDPALCGLAAPELTGWKNGTTGVTKLYELFGNDYVQDTAVKQPTGVMATAPLLVSDGTARVGEDAVVGSGGTSVILHNTVSPNANYWSFAGWDKSTAFAGSGDVLVDFDAECNVEGVIIGCSVWATFGSGLSTKKTLKNGKYHYQAVVMVPGDRIGDVKNAWFGLYKRTSAGAYPLNDTEGLAVTISNVSTSYAPAVGYTDPMDRALIPQVWFDGSDDELTNTPLTVAFTGYAPVGTPGNSFTISATPTARVAFASVHDAAKQAQVIAALNAFFGFTFEMSAYRVALPDAALFATSVIAGSSATFDAAEQSWHLQNATAEGVTLWLSQTVRGEPKLPAGATIRLSGRTKGSGSFALYDAAYALISGNVVTTTDYIDFYQIGGTTYAAAQTACVKRSEKIDRYFKALISQKM